MDASIVMLSRPLTDAATQYAASLARVLAVRLVQAPPAGAPPASPAPPAHQPLLLVLPGSASAEHLADEAQRTLRASALPVLVVPSPAAGRMPPRRIALAAEGEPFVLGTGLRALNALLLTLPTRLTVLHSQLPQGHYSAADALHAVQACGLALRHLTIDAREVPALDPASGILAGVQELEADLLVLPVRPRRPHGPAFAGSVVARVLARSPVPVLLLPVDTLREGRWAA
ncbi:universal stress protein [Hymenobacter convexus]|uniref:universal stress protein n=1 Tax=Hymenobacter sp. CA1UV-4 TaxID=3063782 RepID=UPI00271258C4|nr:universal stress protein [Hymenobacter sp. CA1UV-4]MDO7852477.1 universal stress protein [Hymenobacter sp. CA1UV-4]